MSLDINQVQNPCTTGGIAEDSTEDRLNGFEQNSIITCIGQPISVVTGVCCVRFRPDPPKPELKFD